MGEKLDCCVVRDLLPGYIEGLSEPETAGQVAAHLEGCEACRALEADLRADLPVPPAPKRALRFLKKVKRTRLVAALLTAVLALLCMWWLYDGEYHWRGDLASLSVGLQDYLGWTEHLEGQDIQALATLELDGALYVSFRADGAENIHGIVELDRGINGKYQFVRGSYAPFPYTGGVFVDSVGEGAEKQYLFAGDNCREIYAFTAQFRVFDSQGENRTIPVTFPVEEGSFLFAYPDAQLDYDRGSEALSLSSDSMTLLDRDGGDVTGQYRDETVTQTWGGGIGTAERGLLYVFLGIVALLGAILVRYFLT